MKQLFCLLIILCFANLGFGQSKSKTQEQFTVVKEGKGINGINVGISTMADVVKKFGKDYKWIVNGKYSYQMSYPKQSLAFYMCQSDKNKQIFLIEIKAPFKAKTSKGIAIGKSTLADIHRIYGKKKGGGLEYRGVSFYYNEVKGKEIVTEIDITENAGLRQCRENKVKSKK